jgi:hypothetical protein
MGARPRQNRVNPLGELIAVPDRGTLLGNRGCLHDEQQRVRRRYNGRRWIYCVLEFRGRRQIIMAPRHYTQLFFLDEATALAAGHRPCFECQRDRARQFQAAWAAANPEQAGGPAPGADLMDAVLHKERVGPAGQKVTYPERLASLPPGTMVLPAGDDQPYLVEEGRLRAWHPGGYGPPSVLPPETTVRVLTPRSVVRASAQGFRVATHPSAAPAACTL